MAIRSYQDLIVWQKAMDLVEATYTATRPFPREELYGLTSQLRRAAVSIPSNIAEGHGRQSTREYVQHLSIARGSLNELETQVLLARRLDYLNESQLTHIMSVAAEVGRLLSGLTNSLTAKYPSRAQDDRG